MNRYAITFQKLAGDGRIGFCPFAVLGNPDEKRTLERVQTYLENGADFLELGIPFSDPIADGPIIAAASEKALKNGITTRRALRLIKKIRRHVLHVPIGILTYANIVIRYGIQKFYRDLSKAGADSLLIADLPLEEIFPFTTAAKKNGIHQIFLVSENTTLNRLKKIEKLGSGFLYVTSILGVTGVRRRLPLHLAELIKKLRRATKLPLMVGFGISKAGHLNSLQRFGAQGGIVGSALVATPIQKLPKILNSFRNP